MPGGYFNDAGSFVVDMVFSLYMLAVLLRFLFQLFGVDFYNPIAQAVVKLTDPPLKYLRGVIPGLYGVDLAPLVLLLIVAFVKVYLLFVLNGINPGLGAAFALAVAECLQFSVYVLIVAIFARAILSWFHPQGYHPAMRLLGAITEPVLRPARRLVPNLGGLDLSPMVVFIVLMLVLKLVVQPISDFGLMMLQ